MGEKDVFEKFSNMKCNKSVEKQYHSLCRYFPVIDEIMEPILKDLPYVEGDEVYVLVNSLGATPLIDLHVCYRRVAQILEEKGIKVYKALVGPFACSMDMAGMSVTLMKLDDELKELMDAPCDTPYFTQK